jgi:hypothetical protein
VLKTLAGDPVRVERDIPTSEPVYPFVAVSLISAPDRNGIGRNARFFARPLYFVRAICKGAAAEAGYRIANRVDEVLTPAFGQVVADGATFEVLGIRREQLRTLPAEVTEGGETFLQTGGLYRVLIHERN